jgi:hypothetical protein
LTLVSLNRRLKSHLKICIESDEEGREEEENKVPASKQAMVGCGVWG